jgi:hypothetical protein
LKNVSHKILDKIKLISLFVKINFFIAIKYAFSNGDFFWLHCGLNLGLLFFVQALDHLSHASSLFCFVSLFFRYVFAFWQGQSDHNSPNLHSLSSGDYRHSSPRLTNNSDFRSVSDFLRECSSVVSISSSCTCSLKVFSENYL